MIDQSTTTHPARNRLGIVTRLAVLGLLLGIPLACSTNRDGVAEDTQGSSSRPSAPKTVTAIPPPPRRVGLRPLDDNMALDVVLSNVDKTRDFFHSAYADDTGMLYSTVVLTTSDGTILERRLTGVEAFNGRSGEISARLPLDPASPWEPGTTYACVEFYLVVTERIPPTPGCKHSENPYTGGTAENVVVDPDLYFPVTFKVHRINR